VTEPTREQVEALLDDYWAMDLDKGPVPMRGVLVEHLKALSASRAYEVSAAERIADTVVAERGGHRRKTS
jgi:hypothetical protein